METTIGILSVVEGALAEESKRLWRLFESASGSTGVQSFDYPNLTFQAGRCHDLAAVKGSLTALRHHLAPFTVTVNGLDYFDSPSKTVFLSVQLTAELLHVHHTIDDLLSRRCATVFEHYRPEKWRPHITVAMGDLTDENFAHAWQDLHTYRPHYQQTVSNLCLAYLNESTQHTEIVHREALGLPQQLGQST